MPANPIISSHDLPKGPWRWRHFVTSLDPVHGGVARIVPAIRRAELELGHDASIDTDLGEFERRLESDRSESEPRFAHIHGLWEPALWRAERLARHFGLHVIVSFHGMLDRWAREQKGFKKRIAWRAYQGAMLQRAFMAVVNTEEERAEAREWLAVNPPIAVVPNGVEPIDVSAEQGNAWRREWCIDDDAPLLLYLGRIHPKKGVFLLPGIVRRVAWTYPNVKLVVAGAPDRDDDILPNLHQSFAAQGVAQHLIATGLLDGAERLGALAAANLFLLPSSQEGMPMAALEAMSAAVPVLLTPACRLPMIEEIGAGSLVPRDEEAFAREIIAWLGDRDRCHAAGQAGHAYVRAEHTWRAQAECLVDSVRDAWQMNLARRRKSGPSSR